MSTEKIVVRFRIPFLIRVGDPGTDELEVFTIPFDEYSAKIGFDMEPGGTGGITTAAGAEEDRLGNLSTTKVQIVFEGDFLQSIPEDVIELPESAVFQMSGGGKKQDKNGYIAHESARCVNRFVRIYKSITQSYWMRNLLPHDIFDFIIIEVDDEGEASERRYQHNAGVMRGMGSTLEEEKDERIREMLQGREEPTIYTRMQLRVRDEMSLKEYDLAIVDTQRVLERWVKDACEHLLMEYKGLTETEAMGITRTDDGSFMNIHDILDQFNARLDFDIKATSEYQDWHDEGWVLRNEVIHEGKKPSEEEAVRVIGVSNDLIMLIKTEFRQYLHSELLEIDEMPEDGIGRTTMFDDT